MGACSKSLMFILMPSAILTATVYLKHTNAYHREQKVDDKEIVTRLIQFTPIRKSTIMNSCIMLH